MSSGKFISDEELKKSGSVGTLSERVNSLLRQQISTWELASVNYSALNQILTKKFNFGYFEIEVHFNPGRIRSSVAKTDAKSISERPCFLCAKNMPPQQKGIAFRNDYIILTNPFPIFNKHLTIVKTSHIQQQIEGNFGDLLELGRNLPDFTVFYNGPRCGASAPDHLHFQAGVRRFMPVEKEFESLRNSYSELLWENNATSVFAVENYLRRFIGIITSSKDEAVGFFEKAYNLWAENESVEPMMNILCYYEYGRWHIIIFPRDKQRPSHFLESGEKQIIVGPAAVELGGILILPREEDFEKITEKEIEEIYNEVTMNPVDFDKLKILFSNYPNPKGSLK